MEKFEYIVPCHFGVESVLKNEITGLGYEISAVEDGRVIFYGDAAALCRANIFLRSAERVLLKIGSFHAETFDELFEGTKKLPIEEFVPENGRFFVAKAASVKSKLFSPSDIQSIMKKAMVEKMKQFEDAPDLDLFQRANKANQEIVHGVKQTTTLTCRRCHSRYPYTIKLDPLSFFL